jgi:hypothetical protein
VPRPLHRAAPLALLAVVFPGLAACPGSLGYAYVPPGGGPGGDTGAGAGAGGAGVAIDAGDVPTSCADADGIIRTACGGCHTNPPVPVYAGLDLVSPGVAQRLVGHPTDTSTYGACKGKGNLLDRGVLPATGILIDKITHDTPSCGLSMPYDIPLLSDADQSCLQAWANGLVESVGN